MHIFSVIYHIVYMYDVVVCSVSVFLPVCMSVQYLGP